MWCCYRFKTENFVLALTLTQQQSFVVQWKILNFTLYAYTSMLACNPGPQRAQHKTWYARNFLSLHIHDHVSSECWVFLRLYFYIFISLIFLFFPLFTLLILVVVPPRLLCPKKQVTSPVEDFCSILSHIAFRHSTGLICTTYIAEEMKSVGDRCWDVWVEFFASFFHYSRASEVLVLVKYSLESLAFFSLSSRHIAAVVVDRTHEKS